MRLTNKDLFRHFWPLLLTGFGLTFFSGFGQTIFFGVHIPFIRESFSMSNTELSAYYSSATLLSGFLIFFTGKAMDHLKPSIVMLFVICGIAAGSFMLAGSTYLPAVIAPLFLFLGFLFLRHFGQGFMSLANTVSMNRYIEQARGRAMAWTQFGLPAHAILFPLIGAYILSLIGWENAYILYGIFMLAVLLPAFFLAFRRHERAHHNAWLENISKSDNDGSTVIKQWTRRNVLTDWRFYVLNSILLIGPCFSTAIFYYQGDLAAAKGLGITGFVTYLPFMTLASVTAMYIGGSLLDRFGEKYVFFTDPLIYLTGLLLLSFVDAELSLLSGLIFIGLATGLSSVLGGPLIAHLYGTKHLGSIKSLMTAIMIGGTAVSPVLSGIMLDSGIGIERILFFFALYTATAWAIMIITLGKRLD